MSEQRWLIVLGEALSYAPIHGSFKISFSLIEIGIVIPFLFFYVTSLNPLEEVVNRLRTVEAMDGDFDALEDLGVASTR